MGNRKCSEFFGAFFVYKCEIIFGERVWESNPPRTLLTPNTGFEDQGAHQLPDYLLKYIPPNLSASNNNTLILIFQVFYRDLVHVYFTKFPLTFQPI